MGINVYADESSQFVLKSTSQWDCYIIGKYMFVAF